MHADEHCVTADRAFYVPLTVRGKRTGHSMRRAQDHLARRHLLKTVTILPSLLGT